MIGRVVDPQGAVVANAEITLAAPRSRHGPSARRRMGRSGFGSIAPGTYTVRTDAAGFSPSSQTITSPSAAPLAITLQVAGLSEDVTVGARSRAVATGKTTLPVRLAADDQSVSRAK